ncbi:MAG: hypothetical protein ACR5K6_02485 [Wolbachia sp.]
MIMKYGGTPGKLLYGIYVKDANMLKNVTTVQATIRCVLSGILWCMLSSPQAFGLVSPFYQFKLYYLQYLTNANRLYMTRLQKQ